MGELALQTGQPERAAAAFRGVLSRRPDDFDALLGLARALEDSGKLDEAEAAYRRVIRAAPGNWAAYNQLGGFYFARGRYAQAEPLFRKVTEIAPDSARGYSNLGAALHRMDRYEDAVAAYRKSIAISPTSAAYSNAGTTEFYLGRYEAAAADFEKAVALSPESYRSWANLADAYHWAGRREDRAREAYENAIRLARGRLQVNPRDAAARALLAVCLVRTGALAEARSQIEEALRAADREPSVLYQAALVAHAAGDRAEALAKIRGAVEAGYGVLQIAREPEFADLRGDEKFREVLRLGPSKAKPSVKE
jgi:tetratricopeptide (TPR) repeat protein